MKINISIAGNQGPYVQEPNKDEVNQDIHKMGKILSKTPSPSTILKNSQNIGFPCIDILCDTSATMSFNFVVFCQDFQLCCVSPWYATCYVLLCFTMTFNFNLSCFTTTFNFILQLVVFHHDVQLQFVVFHHIIQLMPCFATSFNLLCFFMSFNFPYFTTSFNLLCCVSSRHSRV